METDRFNTSIRNAANQFNSQANTRAAGHNLDRAQAIAGTTNSAAGKNVGIRRQNRQDMEDTGEHFANFSNSLGSLVSGGELNGRQENHQETAIIGRLGSSDIR